MRKLLVALAIGILAVPSQAAVITFQQGVGGYTGVKFVTLAQLAPNDTAVNGGSAAAVWTVDGGNTSFNDGQFKHGLLRFDSLFDNAGGPIPAGSTINSAVITANYTDNSSTAFSVNRMLVTWDPATSTWSNMTGGIQTNNIEAATTASATFSNPNGNVVATYAVTYATGSLVADVQAWSNGASNFGWAYLPTSGTSGWGWTAAGGNPVLSIDYTVVPEPSTAALIAGALASLGLRRRRHA